MYRYTEDSLVYIERTNMSPGVMEEAAP